MNIKEPTELNTYKIDAHDSLPKKLSFDVFKQTNVNKKKAKESVYESNYIFRGLVGHGVQSWYWRIIWQTSHCGVALDIPLRGAYSDIEENDNVNAQDIGDLFVNTCLSSTQEGLYYRNQEVRLYIVMDADELTFRIFTMNTNKILHEGSTLIELLNILDNGHNKN